VEDLGVVIGDEAHSAHVRRERIDLIDPLRGNVAVLPAPQIEYFEFIGVGGCVLRLLQVDASNPVSPSLEKRNEMVSDESPRPGNQYPTCRTL
jgi:hypothetical protein